MRVIAARNFLKLAACSILFAPALVSCGAGSHSAGPSVVPYAVRQALPAQQTSVTRAAVAETSAVQAYFEPTESVEPTCNVFPLICVVQGSSKSIVIKVTCTRNGKTIN